MGRLRTIKIKSGRGFYKKEKHIIPKNYANDILKIKSRISFAQITLNLCRRCMEYLINPDFFKGSEIKQKSSRSQAKTKKKSSRNPNQAEIRSRINLRHKKSWKQNS